MQTYHPGTRIGQYEIASRPMMGGMGVVYFALDHGNDSRPVAIKTFRPELLPDRAARDRFLREGTAWIELGSHAHIVRCYKVEYIDPTAFLVLELIAKEQNMPDASLRSWLIPGHPLPFEQALLFALQIARGMQYATEKIPGFVHRDLKPENILVGTDKLPGTNVNRLRVTDFGLVKTIADGELSEVSSTEEPKPNQFQFTRGAGTPLYMAPEQWKGEPIGAYTDVYAFGCILYEMLSGQSAAEGKTITELQASHCDGKLRLMSINFPNNLDAVLVKSFATNPVHRYQGWDEVVEAIEDVCSKHGEVTKISLPEFDRRDDAQTGWSYNTIGVAYLGISKADVAIKYFEKILSIEKIENIQELYGSAFTNLGSAYVDLGDFHRAIEYHEQALIVAENNSDLRLEGFVLGNIGEVYRNLGDFQKAIKFYEQSLAIARKVGSRYLEGNALNNLGVSYRNLGNPQQAIEHFEQVLIIRREMGDTRGLASGLANLGNTYIGLEDFQRGVDFLNQSLRIFREIGDRQGEGMLLSNLGVIFLRTGNKIQSVKLFEQALLIVRETNAKNKEYIILNNLGAISKELKNLNQSVEYYEQALSIAREIGDRKIEGDTLGDLGKTIYQLGDITKAINYLEQQLIIVRENGNQHEEGNILVNLGVMYANLGDNQQAIGCYEKSLLICRETNDMNGLAGGLYNMALFYSTQDANHALSLAQEAAIIFAQIKSSNFQQAQVLVTQLKREVQNPAQAAYNAFQRASSLHEMQGVVHAHPFMLEPDFLRSVGEVISEQVPPEQKPIMQQRLSWLRQIAAQK